MADTVLHCEGGHTWTRPPQRGRPPRFCPNYPACKHDKAEKAFTGSTGVTLPDRVALQDKPKPRRDIAAESNPFVQKAKKENPFLKLAKSEPLELNQSDQKRTRAPKRDQTPVERSESRKRPGSEVEHDWSCEDPETHNDASLPGVQLSELKRDAQKNWTCRLTLNGETFVCYRRGGWTMDVPETLKGETNKNGRENGSARHILPNVAAFIQEYVGRLERKYDPAPEEKPKRKAKGEDQDEQLASAG